MRKESKLKHLFVSLMILGCSFGFTACDDDDDPVKDPVLTDVYGEYSGKMTMDAAITYAAAQAEGTEGIDIAATVNNDTVTFAKFPVDAIIKAIIADEAAAEGIIQAIGDVKYTVGYKGEFNAAKDSVMMEFAPKPLNLEFSMGEGENAEMMEVIVDISAVDKGSYAVDKKNLKFAIKATGVTVDGTSYPFPETQFSFNMNKK